MGAGRTIYEPGTVFGKLEVIRFSRVINRIGWTLVKCVCGSKFEVRTHRLKTIRSCMACHHETKKGQRLIDITKLCESCKQVIKK